MKTATAKMLAEFVLEHGVPIPEWARYIAQDRDGEWYAYTHKPTQIHSNFLHFHRHTRGKRERLVSCVPHDVDVEDWVDQMYKL